MEYEAGQQMYAQAESADAAYLAVRGRVNIDVKVENPLATTVITVVNTIACQCLIRIALKPF